MTSFTLKNIPDELYRELKAVAELHRRSINSEVLSCLERHLGASTEPAEVVARARQIRRKVGGPPVTLEELQDARESGRP